MLKLQSQSFKRLKVKSLCELFINFFSSFWLLNQTLSNTHQQTFTQFNCINLLYFCLYPLLTIPDNNLSLPDKNPHQTSYFNHFFPLKKYHRAGEMPQQITEDLESIRSTHRAAHSSRGYDSLFWPPMVPCHIWCSNIHAGKSLIYIK